MQGRPPKPTDLLLLTGAGRKNPKRLRARAGEPKPPSPTVGGPPAKWMIFHPDVGYLDAEKLRAIWDECVAMWPWMTFSDRAALKRYCELALKEEKHTASASDQRLAQSICTELGGTGSGRARLGMHAGSATPAAPKGADPRAEFLARKFG
jgi:hypothetical protein